MQNEKIKSFTSPSIHHVTSNTFINFEDIVNDKNKDLNIDNAFILDIENQIYDNAAKQSQQLINDANDAGNQIEFETERDSPLE